MQPLGNRAFARRLAAVFGTVVATRNFLYDRFPGLAYRASRPVVSIGAVHAGGTGKTPMALLAGAMLSQQGYAVAFLSRGYGRRQRAVVIVGPNESTSWDRVGDEPALLHANLPGSWLGIGPRRRATARLLQSRLPQRAIFILDDGFQHRALARNADIVCLPCDPFADALLPAGVLREPLTAIRRAHLLCVIGTASEVPAMESTRRRLLAEFPGCPVALLHQAPVGWFTLAGRKLETEEMPAETVAVCGIARPERFIAMIEACGIRPKRVHIFRDHYIYSKTEFDKLREFPAAMILTTEKDAYRFSSLGLVSGDEICYLKVALRFADHESELEFGGVLRARGI